MSVHHMRVAAAAAAVLALSAAGYANDTTDQANPDTKALLEYVKKLESRVNQLESEREWPIDQARAQSGSALEAAVRSVNLSGYMEFQYGYNFRHGGRNLLRGDTMGFNQWRGTDADENQFSFQNLALIADKPVSAIGSTGFHVMANFGHVSRFANRDGAFTNPGHAFDVREAYMTWRWDPKWGLSPFIDLSVGKFGSPFNFESLDNTNNWQVTRSPMFVFGTPATLTGLKAVMPWQECNKTTLYVVNGWDVVRDPADGKTAIITQDLGKYDWLNSSLQFNGSYGNEGSIPRGLTTVAPDGNKTWALEAIWRGDFSPETHFALDAFWAETDNGAMDATGSREDHEWHGIYGYVQHNYSKDLWISGRLGYYSDNMPMGTNFRNVDITLTLGYNVAADMTFAVEYRHDFGRSGDYYMDADGDAISNQDTLTASFLYRF